MSVKLISSILRRFFLAIAVILIALILTLPALLNAVLEFPESRAWIAGEVRSTLGRELRIDGEVRLNLYTLTPGFRLTDVRLSNAPWASRPDMLELDYFDVHLSLVPLLISGELDFRSVVLGGAHIYLEQKDGRANWHFAKLSADAEKTPARNYGTRPLRLLADHIAVRNAKIRFATAETTYVLDLDALDAAFAEDGDHMHVRGRLTARYGNSDLRGSFDVREEPLSIRVNVQSKLLDVDDLLKRSAKHAAPPQSATTQPATTQPATTQPAATQADPAIPYEELLRLAADVEWASDQIKYRQLKISDAQLKTKLAAGRLVAEQVRLKFADGSVAANLAVDAAQQSLELKLRLEELSLKLLLQAAGAEAFLDGPLSLDVRLKGSGPRLDALRRSLAGRIVLEVGAAGLDQAALYRTTGPAVAGELRTWAAPLPDIECVVLGADIHAGRGRSDVFLVDTNEFTLTGSGYADLHRPAAPDFVLMFDDRHLSLLDLADHLPIHIGGTFRRPAVSVWQRDDAVALFQDVLEFPELPVDLVADMLGLDKTPANVCAAARAKAAKH